MTPPTTPLPERAPWALVIGGEPLNVGLSSPLGPPNNIIILKREFGVKKGVDKKRHSARLSAHQRQTAHRNKRIRR